MMAEEGLRYLFPGHRKAGLSGRLSRGDYENLYKFYLLVFAAGSRLAPAFFLSAYGYIITMECGFTVQKL